VLRARAGVTAAAPWPRAEALTSRVSCSTVQATLSDGGATAELVCVVATSRQGEGLATEVRVTIG
jgi:hypothetical protein